MIGQTRSTSLRLLGELPLPAEAALHVIFGRVAVYATWHVGRATAGQLVAIYASQAEPGFMCASMRSG